MGMGRCVCTKGRRTRTVRGAIGDLLLFTNVPATGVVDLPLTNLAPGKYTFGLTVREPAGDWRLFPGMVTFTVTNRVRTIPRYLMTVLPGGTNTRPAKINNKGQVVGVSGGKAFLFENGVMRSLGTLGGTYSEATAINNNGQIVGVADDGEGIRRPFLWEEARGMVRMPINQDPTAAAGRAGDFCIAAGTVLARQGRHWISQYAFRYHGYQRDRVTPSGAHSWPSAINNLGDIVGYIRDNSYGPRG